MPVAQITGQHLKVRIQPHAAALRLGHEAPALGQDQAHGAQVEVDRVAGVLALVEAEVVAEGGKGDKVEALGVGDGDLGRGRAHDGGDVGHGLGRGIVAPLRR